MKRETLNKTLILRTPTELALRLERFAAARGVSSSEIVRESIAAFLRREESELSPVNMKRCGKPVIVHIREK